MLSGCSSGRWSIPSRLPGLLTGGLLTVSRPAASGSSAAGLGPDDQPGPASEPGLSAAHALHRHGQHTNLDDHDPRSRSTVTACHGHGQRSLRLGGGLAEGRRRAAPRRHSPASWMMPVPPPADRRVSIFTERLAVHLQPSDRIRVGPRPLLRLPARAQACGGTDCDCHSVAYGRGCRTGRRALACQSSANFRLIVWFAPGS